jgi:hypothetical protein
VTDEVEVDDQEEAEDWTTEMTRRAKATADRALTLADQALDDGRARDAQAAATTAGILIDKVRTATREHRTPIATDPDAIDVVIRAQLVAAAADAGWAIHPIDEPCPASGRKAEQ